MLSKSLIFCAAAGCSLIAMVAFAGDKTAVDPKLLPPASTKQGVTYTNDIQPIFAKSCYPCHGPKTQKPKGKFRADSLEAVLKGGEDGPCVIVGNSGKSDVVIMVSHQGDADDYMPPPKNKGNIAPLTPEQIGLIRAWIDQGAK